MRSLHWELPFGLLPNETDLAQGKLLLSLSAPGENSASISNLVYASVATMRVLGQRTTDLDPGLSYSCRISQASSLPIAFEVKSGQSVGYPAGNNTNSRARIQLLDANGSPTTTPANAVSILQFRGQGGFVTFDRTSGKVTSYSTRTGRVTDFTGTDKIDIIYTDATETEIKQIRTDVGLLTISENAARQYTVAIYAPGQFGTTKDNGVYPVNPGALARRTAVVNSDVATPDITTITVDQSGREYKYVYEFTSAVLTHEWVMKRYLNNVLTTTQSKKVTYATNGRTTERKVIDRFKKTDKLVLKRPLIGVEKSS